MVNAKQIDASLVLLGNISRNRCAGVVRMGETYCDANRVLFYQRMDGSWQELSLQVTYFVIDDSDQRCVNERRFGITGKYIKKAVAS